MNTQSQTDRVDALVADAKLKIKLLRYSKISEKAAKLEREKSALKAELMQLTHCASHIMDNKGHDIASWQQQVRHIFDTQRIKIEQHDIYEKYLKETSFFVLITNFKG